MDNISHVIENAKMQLMQRKCSRSFVDAVMSPLNQWFQWQVSASGEITGDISSVSLTLWLSF